MIVTFICPICVILLCWFQREFVTGDNFHFFQAKTQMEGKHGICQGPPPFWHRYPPGAVSAGGVGAASHAVPLRLREPGAPGAAADTDAAAGAVGAARRGAAGWGVGGVPIGTGPRG